ncbi:hypothetical protein B7494_g5687 [Chlorociboria aeruginascens]|nr:hypothetical protein B7494_g5687 [Chlorociboria aeruginascens]
MASREQESPIVLPLYEQLFDMPHSPLSNQSRYSTSHENDGVEDHLHHFQASVDLQNSHESGVDDTQFVAIEPGSLKSGRSLVEDTQFVQLELDTRVAEEFIFSQAGYFMQGVPDALQPPIAKGSDITLPQNLIERPKTLVEQDPAKGFKFAVPIKAPARQFNRQLEHKGRTSSRKSSNELLSGHSYDGASLNPMASRFGGPKHTPRVHKRIQTQPFPEVVSDVNSRPLQSMKREKDGHSAAGTTEQQYQIPSSHENRDSTAAEVVNRHEHNSEDRTNMALRRSSPPPAQNQSRPRSSQSNRGQSMRRPLAVESLVLEGVAQNAFLRTSQPSKIQRSRGKQVQSGPELDEQTALAPTVTQNPLPNSLRSGDIASWAKQLQATITTYEQQMQVIKEKLDEIDQLKVEKVKTKEQIQLLEADNSELAQKVKKLDEKSAFYRDHINRVILTQKYLKAQSGKILEDTKELRALYEKRKAQITRLENIHQMIEETKKIDGEIDQLKKRNKELEKETKLKESHKTDFERVSEELVLERSKSEKLQKKLNERDTEHKELVEAITNAQNTVTDKLTGEGGLLSNISESKTSTQEKYGSIKAIKNGEMEASPAMRELIKELFSKLETKLQVLENVNFMTEDSDMNPMKRLEEYISQLYVDYEAQTKLNNTIAELQAEKTKLGVIIATKESDLQNKSNELEQLALDVANCHKQLAAKSEEIAAKSGELAAKSEELATVLASPREDPLLVEKLQGAETINSSLQARLDDANQQASAANEEIHRLKKSSCRDQQRITDLKDELQSMKQTYEKKYDDLLSSCKKRQEKSAQEASKAIQEADQKSTSLTKQYIEVFDELKQKISGLEPVKEELQKIRKTSADQESRINEFQEQLTASKDHVAQLEAYIQMIENKDPKKELDRWCLSHQSLQNEFVALRRLCQNDQKEKVQNFEKASIERRDMQSQLKGEAALERELQAAKGTIAHMQTELDAYKARISQSSIQIVQPIAEQNLGSCNQTASTLQENFQTLDDTECQSVKHSKQQASSNGLAENTRSRDSSGTLIGEYIDATKEAQNMTLTRPPSKRRIATRKSSSIFHPQHVEKVISAHVISTEETSHDPAINARKPSRPTVSFQSPVATIDDILPFSAITPVETNRHKRFFGELGDLKGQFSIPNYEDTHSPLHLDVGNKGHGLQITKTVQSHNKVQILKAPTTTSDGRNILPATDEFSDEFDTQDQEAQSTNKSRSRVLPKSSLKSTNVKDNHRAGFAAHPPVSQNNTSGSGINKSLLKASNGNSYNRTAGGVPSRLSMLDIDHHHPQHETPRGQQKMFDIQGSHLIAPPLRNKRKASFQSLGNQSKVPRISLLPRTKRTEVPSYQSFTSSIKLDPAV